MKEFAGFNSTVTIFLEEDKTIERHTIKGLDDACFKPRNPLEKALLGARIGDIVRVNAKESYAVEILEIENPVDIKDFLRYDYEPELEGALEDGIEDGTIPFPFNRRIYVGDISKHKCQKKKGEWDRLTVRFYCKKGYHKKEVYICKKCKICVVNSKPYDEEYLKGFYKVYDLNDGKILNEKVIMTPTQKNVAFFQSLPIQGGSFNGK